MDQQHIAVGHAERAQGLVGGACRDADRRALGRGHGIRKGDELLGRDRQRRGVGAERIADRDAVADREALDALAEHVDHSGSVEADRSGLGDVG